MAVKTVTVRYRMDPDNQGLEDHDGTYLCDLAWTGKRLWVFSIGDRTPIGRLGMSYIAVLEAGPSGKEPVLLHELGEGCHGSFVDGFDVLLLPQFKSGPRKGHASLLVLPACSGQELTLRGYADFRPFAARDGKILLAGPGIHGGWAGWQELSLRDGGGKPGRIVSCTLA